MLVAALYNIVDQIYIGHISGVDAASGPGHKHSLQRRHKRGLPLHPYRPCPLPCLWETVPAALFSLCRGKRDYRNGEKSIGNGFMMQIILLVLLTVFGIVFRGRYSHPFQSHPAGRKYAEIYFDVIILGFPAYMFSQGMNSAIRADGSPKYAMIATSSGAVLNIILDPIFIFTFGMGIKGAAIATVIGQYVTPCADRYLPFSVQKFPPVKTFGKSPICVFSEKSRRLEYPRS